MMSPNVEIMNENMDDRISKRSVEFSMTIDREAGIDTLYSSANDKFNSERLSEQDCDEHDCCHSQGNLNECMELDLETNDQIIQQSKQKQVHVIDKLNNKSSNDLMVFMKSCGYAVINSNNRTQIGLSCGYICACMASEFHGLLSKYTSNWLNSNLVSNWQPDISLYNQILGIEGNVAEELEAQQIHTLVSHLTGDTNLSWFFTVDVNLFKSMVRNSFSNVSMPQHNGKRWSVFAINDAILDLDMMQKAIMSNSCQGDHWYTAFVLLD